MSYSKTWARQFAEGFDEIVNAKDYQLSEYVVVEGINKGHDMNEIGRALGDYASGNAPGHATIRRWVDKYAIAVGLGGDGSPGDPLSISSDNLANAIAASGVKMPDEEDEYVQHYVAEGATLDVAKRIARGEKVGEWLRDNDGWDVEKDRVKPAALVSSGKMTLRSWLTRWTTWMGRTGEFITFLQSTKQDQMGDSTVHKQLYRFAAQFEKQAERFEIGYEKAQARNKARKV